MTSDQILAGVLIAGGILLVAAGVACIIATVGICAAPIAVGVAGGGGLALAGAGTVGGGAVVVSGSVLGGAAIAGGATAVGAGAGVLYNASSGGDGGGGALSPNQMNTAIKRNQAPSGVSRVDPGKVTGEQTHVHFDNGAALNMDGTWKHGFTTLTRAQRDWLRANGWNV